MTDTVERQERMENLADLNTQTLRATEEIISDHNLAPMERLKALNLASRTVAQNNKSLMDQTRAAQQLGLKPSETASRLTFLS